MTEQAQLSHIQQRLQQFQAENASYAQGIRYLLVFLGGLLIGWFVFGWWLVPIRYTQVYPNELHADARSDYFRMVAESYAATQDIGMAAQRLKYWSPEELGPMLYAEATSLEAVNPAVAERLRQIATLLRLSPEGVVAESPGESASSFKEGAASILGLPAVRIGALGLFLLIVLVLVARRFNLSQRLRGREQKSAEERGDVGLEDMVELEDGAPAPVITRAPPPGPDPGTGTSVGGF
ncbi:MAG: hypothetical protein GXP38_01425 [Chloroflexi bacterium]|nr:hypothetical protein [Chloroflexota bacterium]